jgi:hypothetical protein
MSGQAPELDGRKASDEQTRLATTKDEGSVPKVKPLTSGEGALSSALPRLGRRADGSLLIPRSKGFYLSGIVAQEREVEVLPRFDGIEVLVTVMGTLDMVAIALIKFSETYKRAMEEGEGAIRLSPPLPEHGLVWLAGYLKEVSQNFGKLSKEVPLEGMMQAIDALEVANALHIDRAHAYLVDWFRRTTR